MKKNPNIKIPFFINKILLVGVLTLITLIALKASPKFKSTFYKEVYEKNFSFATLNKYYEKYFGSPIPFKNLFKEKTDTVFNEKLTYTESSLYKDGVKLTVGTNYLVPVKENGLVVFIGEKEGYGNTVIIEQADGIDVWYSNLKEINVNLYDYVKKGSLLGENNDDFIYLIFKKEGNVIDYKDYI